MGNHFKKCPIYQAATTGLYLPLLIQESSWESLSIDFMLGLLRTQQGFDIVLVVFDRNSKMARFIASKKSPGATHVLNLFFDEIICFMKFVNPSY